MKNIFKINLLAVLLLSLPSLAAEGIAVIDMRTAVLSTQAANDAFKALEEDADYSSNLEKALSQEDIAKMQKDIQEKGKDIEFLAGKIQQAQEETAQNIFVDYGASMQKIIGELIQAKQIKVLFQKNESILFSDPALDLTDDVTSMLDVAASEASTQSE
jgi:outer membrane protein